MATTTPFTLTRTAWTELASVAGNYLIQLQGFAPARIHVGDAAPAAGAAGVILSGGADRSASITLTSGKIYGRAGVGGEDATKVVVAFGG